ncbi:hypothetical protein V7122_00080 [Bacillus sp. JJ1532]|uniref:hypothetical protein n=1 Tax=unclassified Bacillus (in: firmicutes) TaxID=185979 RepID=UPI002FFEE058
MKGAGSLMNQYLTMKELKDALPELVSVNNELTNMKKLVSFLVQQNEQSRLQQNKVREQNQQLIHEVQELRQTIEEIMTEQKMEHEKVASQLEWIIATQQKSVETKKSKWLWQKLFE